jgi:hypothetical protein
MFFFFIGTARSATITGMKRGKPIEQLDDDRSLQIGRVVVRYSLLENILDSTVRDLLQVTHKEGRLAVKTGSILDRLDLIEDLLGLYGTTTSVDIDKLRERLTTIAQHRNTIVHGAWFLTDKDEVRVRYTKGRWEKEPGAKKGIKRIIRPAGTPYTAEDGKALNNYIRDTLQIIEALTVEVRESHLRARQKQLEKADPAR